jgi:hypothetical protein
MLINIVIVRGLCFGTGKDGQRETERERERETKKKSLHGQN